MAKESVGVARSAAGTATRTSSGVVTSKAPAKNRASDRLEEDAQAMEERLIQLRLKMLEDKQKLEKELPAKFGGSRWRSAQETIGSVSRYAKDVEDRMSKPAAKNPLKKKDKGAETEPSEAKPKKKKKKVPGNAVVVPSVATVKKWTNQHVLEWLTSLSLDELHPAFEFHQVTGAVLLEMQPEEFTHVGVDRLSTRNLLWKELERIKDAASAAVRRGSLEASEIIDPKIKDVALVPETHSPGKGGGIHWSHVKPLRDVNDTSQPAELPVNLADGQFDEDASHASFMKALLDWRAGDDGATTASAQDDEMWFNPLAGSNNDSRPSTKGGGALLDGEYDEVKEQEAFRLAVLAWRRAETSGGETHSRPSTAEIERIEQGCATDQRKSCWQCYRVVRADSLVRDADTKRDFCGKNCQEAFKHEHARLYKKTHEAKSED